MKNKKLLALVLATSFVLTSCFSQNKENIIDKKEKKVSVKTEQKIKEDKTTEVLVDSEIKKEDIVKFFKHGDHWHIFTKDGKEHISYKDPNSFGKDGGVDLVDVVDKNKLKDKNVVAIKKHGDHWHVYTKDGGEYLTYDNPSGLFPNIKVGIYTGSHGSNTTNSSSALNKNSSQKLSGDRVVKILRHGDHWHIYTANGNEFISYTNPSSAYPNIRIGTYRGSHGSNSQNIANNNNISNNIVKTNKKNHQVFENNKKIENSQTTKPLYKKENSENQRINAIKNLKLIPILGQGKINRFDIVKILVHQDHYHIYDSNNREAITYTNPKNLFPNAYFGEYGNKSHKQVAENNNSKIEANKNKKSQVKPEIKPDENKKPQINPDENKKPQVKPDKNHIADVKPDQDKKDDEKWPSGITKIIDHKDHWHLYRGNEEVGVVKENPKDIYPNAEYIVEKSESDNIAVADDEIFNYQDVRAELIKGVIPYLEGDLAKFTNYGNLSEEDAVYGSNGVRENIFYWFHQNHYHAKTIKQIIQMEKDNKFGKYTAKDVVKTIKYKIENPQTQLEYKPEVKIEDVKEFLKNHYQVESYDILNIGDSLVQVFIKDQTLNFYLRDFEMKDGKLSYKKQLPVVEDKKEENEENIKEDEIKEESEDKKIENTEKTENKETNKIENKQTNKVENTKVEDTNNTENKKDQTKPNQEEKEDIETTENNIGK
ncbi:hypothetical protein [Anaerococcus hydrogenalis]|uniref:hypothetical protein n=1 Tax=Anaerococcus hydrogenalis TaxID=33029 RepID=UPI0023F221DE|nr:hypothetical protein [Anaerococcus hydrogenalis]